ncbi:MAG: branched-chain amino acid ABC transporter permease, partial [Devosia sp.]
MGRRGARATASAIVLFVLVVVLTVPFALLGSSAERVVTLLLVNMTAVIGFSIYTGNSGILTVGHVGFFAVGAYTTGLLTVPVALKASFLKHLPDFLAPIQMGLPASLMVVAAVCLVLGFLTGLPISRLRGTSAIVATFGLLVIAYYVIVGATNITNGTKGFYGIPDLVTLPIIYGFLALVIAAAFLFKESPWGLQLRAFQDNEVAAAASGIRINRRLLQAWTLSAVVLG